MFTSAAEKEYQELAKSESLRQDMETVRRNRHNPFIRKDGSVDADAYIAFVTEFNEFIGRTQAVQTDHRQGYAALTATPFLSAFSQKPLAFPASFCYIYVSQK